MTPVDHLLCSLSSFSLWSKGASKQLLDVVVNGSLELVPAGLEVCDFGLGAESDARGKGREVG